MKAKISFVLILITFATSSYLLLHWAVSFENSEGSITHYSYHFTDSKFKNYCLVTVFHEDIFDTEVSKAFGTYKGAAHVGSLHWTVYVLLIIQGIVWVLLHGKMTLDYEKRKTPILPIIILLWNSILIYGTYLLLNKIHFFL